MSSNSPEQTSAPFQVRREIRHYYCDPLDEIWLAAAGELGIEVQRRADVFAAYDGAGRLFIGTPETLDPDDSLAQMIFHELCHWLVEGPPARELPDWGLEVDHAPHLANEYGCLRLQAALAGAFGLRQFLATTTDFRSYYDKLADEPLELGALGSTTVAASLEMGAEEERALQLARQGWQRCQQPPWQPPLSKALTATRRILEVVAPVAHKGSLWRLA